ncbi:MAG: hypothetical protein ACLP5H_07310 [Desulfomonilaceae bacterium]
MDLTTATVCGIMLLLRWYNNGACGRKAYHEKVLFALLTAMLITGSLICTVAWSNDKEKACEALIEYVKKSASVIRQV